MSPSEETQALSDSAKCQFIYDQDCQLCVSITRRLSARVEPGNVKFVPYASEEAQTLLGSTYSPGRPAMAYLIDAEGKTYQGLDAFIPLLTDRGWAKWVKCLWGNWLFRLCGYSVYRIVAKYRYAWFGKPRWSQTPLYEWSNGIPLIWFI